MLDPMMEQLLPGFVDECKEIAERVTDHLIELEKAHEQSRFDDLARGLHTLKGSAATLGLSELSELAHRMEDAVLPLRGRSAALPGAVTDALLKTLDTWMAHLRATTGKSELPDLRPSHKLLEAVGHAVQAVEPGKAAANNGKAVAEKEKRKAAPEKEKKSSKREREARAARAEPAPAEPTAEEEAVPGEEAGSWRVRTREVVSLLHEVERLREVRLRLEERRRELERGLSQLARLGILAQTAEVRALLMGIQRALSADGEEAGDIVASMEDELKAICTLPVRTVLEPLRRSVRDLCRQSGKLARLSIVGGEVSLDRRVLESLRGPLVHLVRNAVDHGLELPDVREARGKHREGIVVVRVEQQGNMLFIEVSDDGNGLDLALIRQSARDLSIVPGAELDAMTPAQLHQLIFRNGFSTRRTVTEVSGRGVGMDVVRSQIQALQGHIEVHPDAPRGAGQLAGAGGPLRRARPGRPHVGGGDVALGPVGRAAGGADPRAALAPRAPHHRAGPGHAPRVAPAGGAARRAAAPGVAVAGPPRRARRRRGDRRPRAGHPAAAARGARPGRLPGRGHAGSRRAGPDRAP